MLLNRENTFVRPYLLRTLILKGDYTPIENADLLTFIF